jgi:hypothetical protein
MEADMLKRMNMFNKLGVTIAACAMLFLVSPPKANAGVRFGINVGPAYVAPYANSYPYGYGYYTSPYPYDYYGPPAYTYPYAYPYGGLSFGWGGGYYGHRGNYNHDYHRDRNFRGSYHDRGGFHGGRSHGGRR